jgi:hypothetical protein
MLRGRLDNKDAIGRAINIIATHFFEGHAFCRIPHTAKYPKVMPKNIGESNLVFGPGLGCSTYK